MSLGKLCDGGCESILKKKVYAVCKDKASITTAPRCKTTGTNVIDIANMMPNVKTKHHASMANSSLAQKN